VPEAVETEEIHFLDGLVGEPMIVRHAIGGDEDAGAIVAEPAMNENLVVVIFEKRKKLRDLVIGRSRPAADRNVYEVHADGFGLLLFPFDFVWIFAAKIDNGRDAEFFEFRDALGKRLCATKKRIVDSSSVGDTGEFQFFAERDRGDGGRRIILRRRGSGNSGEKSEKK